MLLYLKNEKEDVSLLWLINSFFITEGDILFRASTLLFRVEYIYQIWVNNQFHFYLYPVTNQILLHYYHSSVLSFYRKMLL